MKIRVMQVGPLETNCYLLEHGGKIAVIDPGEGAQSIRRAVEEAGGQAEYILLTHGHYDHTTAGAALHAAWPRARVFIHREDAGGAGSSLFPLAGEVEELEFYGEGDVLALGELELRVLHTPGHSPGSVTLLAGDALFTGDTLFAGSCGRVDLPGGREDAMLASLRRLGELEGDFRVLPGHGPGSTLEEERRSNPYMIMALKSRPQPPPAAPAPG